MVDAEALEARRVSSANIHMMVTSFVKQQWITKCLSSLGQTISCVLSEEPNHRQEEELQQQSWLGIGLSNLC